MENIKDTPVVEQTTSQEAIDNAVASAKKRWEKKLDNYVPVEEFNELKSQLIKAQNELKLPKLEQEFVKVGGKKEAFKDFVALNQNIFDCDDKQLAKLLEQAKKDKSYMFDNKSFNATVGSENVATYSNGSLLRTK